MIPYLDTRINAPMDSKAYNTWGSEVSYHFRSLFEYAKLDPEDVDAVYHEYVDIDEGAAIRLVGRLRDGRYFFLSGGCCYTGWDCQGGSDLDTADSFEDLLPQIPAYALRSLGLPAPDDGFPDGWPMLETLV